MKAFVTGGTGFIGRRMVHRLLERGYEVVSLVRDPARAADLQAAGARLVQGDILEPASMVEGMSGSDVVFHQAGWYKLGSNQDNEAHAVNVVGTRNVLELAHELGIPRIIYTSTVAVLGDTQGEDLRSLDENYLMKSDRFATIYDQTKWQAHHLVALPLIVKEAPVIILMPGAVYGPGDTSLVGQFMEAFYKGWLPIFPSPDLTLTFVHVDDIVDAHIRAAEKGKPGETYIVTGEEHSMYDMVQLWSRLSGKHMPLAYVPARYLKPLEPLARLLARRFTLPGFISADAVRIAGLRYSGFPGKAQRELGWGTRAIEDGMSETLEWIAARHARQAKAISPQRRLAGLSILAAVLIFILLRIRHRK